MDRRALTLRHQPETVERRRLAAVHQDALPLRGGRVRVGGGAAGVVRLSAEADHRVVRRDRRRAGDARPDHRVLGAAGGDASSAGISRATAERAHHLTVHRGRHTRRRRCRATCATARSPAGRQRAPTVTAAAEQRTQRTLRLPGRRRQEQLDRLRQRPDATAAT